MSALNKEINDRWKLMIKPSVIKRREFFQVPNDFAFEVLNQINLFHGKACNINPDKTEWYSFSWSNWRSFQC